MNSSIFQQSPVIKGIVLRNGFLLFSFSKRVAVKCEPMNPSAPVAKIQKLKYEIKE